MHRQVKRICHFDTIHCMHIADIRSQTTTIRVAQGTYQYLIKSETKSVLLGHQHARIYAMSPSSPKVTSTQERGPVYAYDSKTQGHDTCSTSEGKITPATRGKRSIQVHPNALNVPTAQAMFSYQPLCQRIFQLAPSKLRETLAGKHCTFYRFSHLDMFLNLPKAKFTNCSTFPVPTNSTM